MRFVSCSILAWSTFCRCYLSVHAHSSKRFSVTATHSTRRALAEKRDNGETRVTTNDGDPPVEGLGGLASRLRDKGASADNVQGGHTEQAVCKRQQSACVLLPLNLREGNSPLRVISALLLEDLGKDGDSRVDGVGNDEDESLRCVLGDRLGDALANLGVDVEEIVTGHAGLSDGSIHRTC